MPEDRHEPAGTTTVQALIERRLRAKAAVRRPIARSDRAVPPALSAGQEQMWFLHRFDPASPAYLMSWVLRLAGRLDVEALRRAWEQVVVRHEILRTRYAGDQEPVQLIDPPGRFDLHVTDPFGADDRQARGMAEWARQRPFDLTTEHPLRVTLVTVGPLLHYLVVAVHHIACDGISYRRIAAELDECYAAELAGRPARLPAVPVQFADFAAWERAARSGGGLRPHLGYWRDELAGLGDLALPVDRPRPARPDPRGAGVDVPIKPATSTALRELGSARRASSFLVLLAGFHAVLGAITGSPDVAVGVPVSGRSMPELDELVGYLVNTVVVRSRTGSGVSFAELLDDVRARFLDAFDHRAAPFKWVVDEVNPARGGGANPLFRAAFDMEPADPGAFALTGLRVDQLPPGEDGSAKFDLTLHAVEAPDGRLFARLEYATAVIDETTARDWAGYCAALLDAVASDPAEPLGRIRERLVAEGLLADRTAAETAVPAAAPAAPPRLVETVRLAWCAVLGDDGIEVTENFFDVGGDSLRAVALAGRLRDEGLAVSAADIFAHQTVEELAAAFAEHRPAVLPHESVAPYALLTAADRAALPPDVVDAYPLAATQLGMLIELRSRPDVHTYQDSTSYLVRDPEPLDVAALRRATQLVVARHEVLRTSFDLSGFSQPLQLVHAAAMIDVGVTDHGQLGADGWRPGLEAYAASERRSPMDLTRAPLIRVHAHVAADAPEWWITITECHPILEGWSFTPC